MGLDFPSVAKIVNGEEFKWSFGLTIPCDKQLKNVSWREQFTGNFTVISIKEQFETSSRYFDGYAADQETEVYKENLFDNVISQGPVQEFPCNSGIKRVKPAMSYCELMLFLNKMNEGFNSEGTEQQPFPRYRHEACYGSMSPDCHTAFDEYLQSKGKADFIRVVPRNINKCIH